MNLSKLFATSAAALTLLVSPVARAAGNQVELTIADDGVSPSTVQAKAGQPLKLVITRKTDSTCINQVVSKDFGIDKPLPLNKPVAVEFTPSKAGTYRLVCGMGMTIANVKVQ